MAEAAVAAIALLIIEDGPEQLRAVEIRPESLGDVQLRVSNLPQEEVADAHLARRTNQQIRVGRIRGSEAGCEQLFIHAEGIEVAFAACGLNDAVDGVQDF